MHTVAITDGQLINASLARVVVTVTGKPTKAQLHASLCEAMQYLAQPVENSFRKVRAGVYTGYMRANKEVRVIEGQELKASYRLMSSAANIVMDKSDQTLWEVKSSQDGSQFLARHGNENLSELIEARVTASREHRIDAPRLNQLQIDRGNKGEFAAFVTASGDLDYGFVIRSSDTKVKIVSKTTRSEVVVPNHMVAGYYEVEIPRQVSVAVAKSVPNLTASTTKMDEAEYWRRAYVYAPEYAEQLIQFIEDGADA